MPRNSAGVYTLPSGNPVAQGTVISANWANDTLGDIASELTQSLDRNGRGGMKVQVKNADGTEALPGITWANEPDSGVYFAAQNDMRASVNGGDVARYIVDPAVAGKQVPFEVWDGSAFIKPLIGAGESPDFADIIVEGDMTAGTTSMDGAAAELEVTSITEGFGTAYGWFGGAGGTVFPASFGIASWAVLNATQVRVTFKKNLLYVQATALPANPISSYHAVELTLSYDAVPDSVIVEAYDGITGQRSDFCLLAVVT